MKKNEKIGEKTGKNAFYGKIYRRIGDVSTYCLNWDLWDLGIFRIGDASGLIVPAAIYRQVCYVRSYANVRVCDGCTYTERV